MTKAETTVERVGGYRVVRRLATGGTSDVLLAKAEGPHGFERTVVLKVLLSQFNDDGEVARMFSREASAYARLSHPSIVRLFDFFALPSSPADGRGAAATDGRLVMVLEHVDGLALSRLRSILKSAGRELDDEAVIYIASRVFDALAAAHAAIDDQGNQAAVIHRDINPANVLVPWDGQVKLADFGVAKVTGIEHHSVAGMIKGTYGYMAPEQVTGEPVTPRADVYAGAIILWELLTRRRAFQRGALPEVEALRAMAEPRLPSIDGLRPDVNRSVRDALNRALEPRASARRITAEEMVSVLASVVPPERGRERLVNALSAVRGEARQEEAGPAPESLGALTDPAPATHPGLAPAVVPENGSRSAPPRPVSVPRITAPFAGGGAGSAAPPQMRPPVRAVSTSTLRAVVPPPDLRRPSAAHRLSLTPSAATPSGAPPPASPSPPAATPSGGAGGASFRTKSRKPTIDADPAPAPAAHDSGQHDRVKIGDAIDEILRGVPSSMPPPVLRRGDTDPVPSATGHMIEGSPPNESTKISATALADPGPPGDGATRRVATAPPVATTRRIGVFPGAAAPLTASAPPEPDFGAAIRDLAAAVAPTVVPPSERDSRPGGTRTLAMAPVVTPPEPPPAVFTAPPPPLPVRGEVEPSPSGDARPDVSLAQWVDRSRQNAATRDDERQSGSPALPGAVTAADAPVGVRPPRSLVGPIAAALAVVVGLSASAFVGYVRWQRTQAARRSVAPATTPAVTIDVLAEPSAAPSSSAAPSEPSAVPSARASGAIAATVGPGPTMSAPVAPASASASPTPVASVAAIAADTGVIRTDGTVPYRRIFVDDKTLGQTPGSVTVKCGSHSVRLGSSGKTQSIDVPCGAEVTVSDKL